MPRRRCLSEGFLGVGYSTRRPLPMSVFWDHEELTGDLHALALGCATEHARGGAVEVGLTLTQAFLGTPHSMQTPTAHGVQLANPFGVIVVEVTIFDGHCKSISGSSK